jgi:hypothetical protein
MSIKHQIRDRKVGRTKTVNLTPLSAIRAFCFECTGYNYYEVEKCTAPLCPLFPFRNPNATKGTRNVSQKTIEILKIARAKRQESMQKDK